MNDDDWNRFTGLLAEGQAARERFVEPEDWQKRMMARIKAGEQPALAPQFSREEQSVERLSWRLGSASLGMCLVIMAMMVSSKRQLEYADLMMIAFPGTGMIQGR